jgi:hypothetical protein
MKFIFPLLITSVFFYETHAQQRDYISDLKNLAVSEMKSQSPFINPHTSRVADNYDVIYHRCEWAIDPAVYYISGKVTTFFKPKDEGFAEIDFDFGTNMSVDSVKYHGAGNTFIQQAGDLLAIGLPGIVPVGQLDSVSVFYHGAPIGSGFGSFIQSYHGPRPIIWTLSEPFGAKDWWPCKQSLNDKIDSIELL